MRRLGGWVGRSKEGWEEMESEGKRESNKCEEMFWILALVGLKLLPRTVDTYSS